VLFVFIIMSQNNTIRKSDKKFIRNEKARIRVQFLDVKKQNELIDNLYKKFLKQPAIEKSLEPKNPPVSKEPDKESKTKSKKVKAKK